MAVFQNNSKFDRGRWKNNDINFSGSREGGCGRTLQETASNLEFEFYPSGPAETSCSSRWREENGLGGSERWVEGSELDLLSEAANHFLGLRSLEKSYFSARFA